MPGVVRKFSLMVRISPCAAMSAPHLVEQGDVGAPETVDGLLGIADDEQLAGLETHGAPVVGGGAPLGQQEDDLRLQRVGVLELVDQQIVESRLKGGAHVAPPQQQVAGLAEQVGEVELAEGRLAHGSLGGEVVRHRECQRRDPGAVLVASGRQRQPISDS